MIIIPESLDAQLKARGWEPGPLRETWHPTTGGGRERCSMKDIDSIKCLEDIPRILAMDVPADYHSYELWEGGTAFSGVWINERIKPFLTVLLELDWDAGGRR